MELMQQRRLATLAHHFTSFTGPSASPSLAKENSGRPKEGLPVVIGGMVLDIQATPSAQGLTRGTTTPGQVRYVQGGVARNVAESMAILGTNPFLISVVGEDIPGDALLTHWKSLGLSVSGIRRCAGANTPVVSAVFDKQGEVAAAVADTSAIEEHLTPEWITQFAEAIRCAPIVMLDANLLPSALEAACNLAKEARVPVWYEPVSVAKSVRATNLLDLITYVSPNEAELVAMADALYQNGERSKPVDNEDSKTYLTSPTAVIWQLRHSIRVLLQAGLKYIILTLGGLGAVLCSADLPPSTIHSLSNLSVRELPAHEGAILADHINAFGGSKPGIPDSKEGQFSVTCLHFPALHASIVNLSGAGDCLVAGTLVSLSANADMVKALAYGLASAKWAIETEYNVPSGLSHALVVGKLPVPSGC